MEAKRGGFDCFLAWIRVVGLPLHLWTGEILKLIGEGCGGFIAINNETVLKTKVMWARLLVNLKEENRPSSINILVGMRSYELQLWWELQSWIAEVYPARGVFKRRKTSSLHTRVNVCGVRREEGGMAGVSGVKEVMGEVLSRRPFEFWECDPRPQVGGRELERGAREVHLI